MAAEYRPEFGLPQAVLGPTVSVAYRSVPKVIDKKLQAAIDELLDTVAENVERFIEAAVAEGSLPKKNRHNKLAAAAGLGKGTIKRILDGSHPPNHKPPTAAQIDTLLKLAWCLDVPFVDLFEQRSKRAIVFRAPSSPPPHEENPGPELKTGRNRPLSKP